MRLRKLKTSFRAWVSPDGDGTNTLKPELGRLGQGLTLLSAKETTARPWLNRRGNGR